MAIITVEINSADISFFKTFFEKMKVKNMYIEDKEDDTLYTKEDFFIMIEKARNGSFSKMDKAERKKMLLD